ncbi:MAG: Cna B-type domain-containing protein, partial [Raoultibacter sp.]
TTWSASIADLPAKDAAGNPYVYRAQERLFNKTDGSEVASRSQDGKTIGAYNITSEMTTEGKTAITNTLDTGGLKVAKTWVDDENRDNKRPGELKIAASTKAGGSTITLDGFAPSVILNKDNTWAHDWGQVPLRDAQGRPITYTLTEPETTGYSPQYQIGTGSTISGLSASTEITKGENIQVAFTNTHTPETLAKTVVKQWSDNSDALGLRPSSLKVTLWATYNNGTSDVKEIAGENTFTSQTGDTWTYEFKDLPKYKTGLIGKEITYSVEEEAVAGYTLTYVGADKLNMMNAIDTTKVQVEKTWIDESNAQNSRLPATVQLYQSLDNGVTWKPYGTPENLDLTVSKSQIISFTGLPVSTKNEQGTPSTYQYKVEESVLGNYATSVSGPVGAVKDGTETITITNTAHKMTLAKTDEAGTALAGATFELSGVFSDTPSGQTATKTLLSGTAERETLIGKLVAGQTYTLIEKVAPDGQKRMPEAVTIVTGENGELSLGAATPSYVTLDTAKRLITVADPPIAVTIEKTAREDGRPLEGSYFDVTGLFVGETAERTVNGTGEALTSQIRGKLRASDRAAVQKATAVDMQGGAVQAAGVYVYTVKETAEPAGYQIEPKPIHFVVDDQGIISVLDDEGTITTVTDGGLTLQFSDPAISVGFVKKNATGTSLANAVLTLSGRFADGSTIKTITSSAAQAVRLDAQLIANQQYSLTEARAPQGYVKLAQPVTFTVDEVGKVTLTGNPEGAASLDVTRTQVTVVDQVAPDPADGASRLTQTGDKANAVLLPLIAVGATAALVGAGAAKRKRQTKR